MLLHLTKRQCVSLGNYANKGKQIVIPLIKPCSGGKRNDPPRAFDVGDRPSKHVLRGREDLPAGS